MSPPGPRLTGWVATCRLYRVSDYVKQLIWASACVATAMMQSHKYVTQPAIRPSMRPSAHLFYINPPRRSDYVPEASVRGEVEGLRISDSDTTDYRVYGLKSGIFLKFEECH